MHHSKRTMNHIHLRVSRRFFAVTAVILMAVTSQGVAAETVYPHLDMLPMDAQHVQQGPDIECGVGPAELKIAEPFVRFNKTDAFVEFTLKCDPRKPNYFTAKIWGNSGADGWPGSVLVLHDPLKGAGPFKQVPFGNNFGKHPLQGEIVRQHQTRPFPNRFYYVTYPIPLELTRGKSAVQLRLVSKGRSVGPDVYRVYAHLDAFFMPAEDEVQGPAFVLGPPRDTAEASAKELYEHWKAEANRGMEKARKMQVFGEPWQQRIRKGEVPAWTYGAISRRGNPNSEYQKLNTDIETWGGFLMRETQGNMGALRLFLSYANAYVGPWSDHHKNPEMLHRIVAGMDFYCKAQGTHGGFLGPSLSRSNVNWPRWIGGPERKAGHHGLEAGQMYLYRALALVINDARKRGLLDDQIDHDLNSNTPKIQRSDAYMAMLKRSYEYASRNVSDRSIANQIMHNFVILHPIHECMQALNADEAVPHEQLTELAEIATGLRKHPRWNHYAYSPDGMPLEDGYDANYGGGGMQLIQVAQSTGNPKIQRKAHTTFESYAHFMFLDNDADGYRVLRNAEWISNRVLKGFPGRIRYFLSDYAGRELKIPAAIRYFELNRAHGRQGLMRKARMEDLSGHVAVAVLGATEKAGHAHRMYTAELPPTDYRLPDERAEDSAFVDEFLGLITLRHKGNRLIGMLNWESRSGKTWATGKANNLVRLRYTTPTVDRLVTATCMTNEGGPLALNVMRYGPYFVAINASEEQALSYELASDLRGRQATDLLTGNQVTLDGGVTQLAPMSSRVFVIEVR